MALTSDFVPGREADLVAFVNNFADRIVAAPSAVGLALEQAMAFQTLANEFVAAWDVTKSRSTRSGSAVIVKNQKKALCVENLRALAKIIQAFPGTTDEQRSLLGLTVPGERRPVPIPTTSPAVEQKAVRGNVVDFRISEAGSTRRGKPDHVSNALPAGGNAMSDLIAIEGRRPVAPLPALPALPASRTPVAVRPATLDDVPFMDALQKRHGRQLGFFPRAQMEGYVRAGHVLVAEGRRDEGGGRRDEG